MYFQMQSAHRVAALAATLRADAHAILRADVRWAASASRGPGGQHANKRNTRADLRLLAGPCTFALVPPPVLAELCPKDNSHLSVGDTIAWTRSETSRSLVANRAECVSKLAGIVVAACVRVMPAGEPPAEQRSRVCALVERAHTERLAAKRRRKDAISTRGRVECTDL